MEALAKIDDDAFEGTFGDVDDDDALESPLDQVDEVLVFHEAMTALQRLNPALHVHFCKSLDPKKQQLLQKHLKDAQENMSEHVKRKKQKEMDLEAKRAKLRAKLKSLRR